MKKPYLVTITDIYTHTYACKAESAEEATAIVLDGTDGCKIYEDFYDTEYEVREPLHGENLNIYDWVEE